MEIKSEKSPPSRVTASSRQSSKRSLAKLIRPDEIEIPLSELDKRCTSPTSGRYNTRNTTVPKKVKQSKSIIKTKPVEQLAPELITELKAVAVLAPPVDLPLKKDSVEPSDICAIVQTPLTNKRRNTGRITRRYNTRSLTVRKRPKRRRTSSKSKTYEYREQELNTEIKPLITPFSDGPSHANTTESTCGSYSGARRLVFPNAAQNIAAFAPNPEVLVEFRINQSDLPKLTEFLGEPIVEQVNRDTMMNSTMPSGYFDSPCRSHAPQYAIATHNRNNQIQRFGHPLFQTKSSPFDVPASSYADDHGVNVQTLKYYFLKLSMPDQRRFMDEMSGELTRRVPSSCCNGSGVVKWVQNTQ